MTGQIGRAGGGRARHSDQLRPGDNQGRDFEPALRETDNQSYTPYCTHWALNFRFVARPSADNPNSRCRGVCVTRAAGDL